MEYFSIGLDKLDRMCYDLFCHENSRRKAIERGFSDWKAGIAR